MPTVYTHVYKVPRWVVLNKMPKGKHKKVLNYVLEHLNGKEQRYPTEGFGEYLLTFRNKGYKQHLPDTYPYTLDPSLLLRAAAEHVKNVISPTSYLGSALSFPIHRLNRKIEKLEDLDTLLDTILSMEDEIGLSQLFQIAESCHSGTSRDKSTFVTNGPVNMKVLTKVSESVITIGDEPINNLVTGDVEFKELDEKLVKFFNGENL